MKARFQDNGFFPLGQQLTLLNQSVVFSLARSMIFLWAPFFLRTDLEKQIAAVVCQPQTWAVVPPDLVGTRSVPSLLEKHSPSLLLTGSESAGRSYRSHQQHVEPTEALHPAVP